MSGTAVQDSIAAKRGYATCDVDTTAVGAIGAPTRNVSLSYATICVKYRTFRFIC